MAAGQIFSVLVCAAEAPGASAGQVGGVLDQVSICPSGSQAYLVSRYVPDASSAAFWDGLALPFDTAVAGGLFGFGFGLVVVFWLIGLKSSVILRPFWSKL